MAFVLRVDERWPIIAPDRHRTASMPTVAQQLQTAREAQSLSIDDVADLTKLRTDHVRALESGNYEIFSAPVYVRGFTRTYATVLKLDVSQILETLSMELTQEPMAQEDHPDHPHTKGLVEFAALYLSRINWKVALPIFLFFALIAIGSLGVKLWQHQQSKDPLENLGEGIYQADRPIPSSYLPLRLSTNDVTNRP